MMEAITDAETIISKQQIEILRLRAELDVLRTKVRLHEESLASFFEEYDRIKKETK